MKHFVIFTTVMLALAALCLLCPDKSAHRAAVTEASHSDGDILQISRDWVLARVVSYQNHLIYSTCSINGQRVSSGFMGRVHVHELDWPAVMGRKVENAGSEVTE